jgi:hypothetical protein
VVTHPRCTGVTPLRADTPAVAAATRAPALGRVSHPSSTATGGEPSVPCEQEGKGLGPGPALHPRCFVPSQTAAGWCPHRYTTQRLQHMLQEAQQTMWPHCRRSHVCCPSRQVTPGYPPRAAPASDASVLPLVSRPWHMQALLPGVPRPACGARVLVAHHFSMSTCSPTRHVLPPRLQARHSPYQHD